MNHVDNQPLELDEKDKFEVELYKGIKNDPYFKHYLYNNFAYFAETMNDMIAGSPFISRGHVLYILIYNNYIFFIFFRNLKIMFVTPNCQLHQRSKMSGQKLRKRKPFPKANLTC